jgi:hypothetical protein
MFFSYSREDAANVSSLVNDVEALGHRTWLDRELGGGQRWWDHILQQIRSCDVFVFAVSERSVNSVACRRELDYALGLQKPVLPALVGTLSANLLPPVLAQLQLVDLRTSTRESAFQLARALGGLPAAPPLPDPLPAPPQAPVSYLGSLQERVSASTSLDIEEQSAVVLELKGALKDPESRDDAQVLLRRLRARRDLFASIAVEIEELLGKQLAPAKKEFQKAPGSAAGPPYRRQTAVWAGLLLAGLAAWALAAGNDSAGFAAIPCVGGAVAGAVIGWDPRMLRFAAACAVAGAVAAALINDRQSEVFEVGLVMGAPAGAFVAAMVVVVLRRVAAARAPSRV